MSLISKVKRYCRGQVEAIYGNYDASRRAKKANRHAYRLTHAELTKREKDAIKELWGNWGGKYWSFQFYKSFCGTFNVQYVPDDYYDYAEHVLNLRWAAFFLQHKCMLKYLLPAANRPKPIVQKIDGHYVTEDNEEMTQNEALSLLKKQSVFIAKDALGPGGGKRVCKVDLQKDGVEELNDILKWHDITFEEIVVQHEFMDRLNPDSVNTIRFVTLNINQRCSVLSAFVRMGAQGSFVDNLSGGNGVLVGVNQDGMFNAFGVDKHFAKQYQSPTGVSLEGLQIPDYEKIKSKITAFHQHIPFANLIGWDIAIDKNGEPVVLEINLDSALVEAHQVFNGPIFGDRLSEVMQYINERKSSLRHSYITY